jgi:response regulator RpfG family c-di-GMP phosphodiesterase
MTEPTTQTMQRILFVDDEPNILSSLKRLFTDEPYEIFTAGSGKEALHMLAQNGNVAVIVSDQRMPEMNGAEFLEKARALVPDAERIVLTGYADIQAAVDAINKGGAYRYIAKPWNDAELIAVIREAASRQALVQENKRLAQIVHQQNAELKQWSTQLEYDVQRQTIEISKKNEELNKFNDRLKKNFHDFTAAFAGLIELRDAKSLSHSRTVSEVAAQTARDLGLPSEEIDAISTAALLHDIGKIGIPDVLLIKSYEGMTREEQREYQLHPVRGQAAIDSIEDLRQIGTIIRGHHEAFNGTGYPDGLKSEKIPLGARIIAVADFFDRTFALQQAVNAVDLIWARIKQDIGVKFDPAVCLIIEKPIRNIYGRKTAKNDMVELELSIPDLTEGMLLSRDVRSGTGLLLLSKGTNLAAQNLQALKRHHQLDPSKGGVYVWAKR